MKFKVLIIVVLAAVGIGAAFIALGGLPANTSTTSQYLTSAATTGDVTDDVAATGTVAATSSYGLAFGTKAHLAGGSIGAGSSTWTVTDLKVKVGDTVNTGDVLATADTTELKRQLEQATDNWKAARIQQVIAQEALDAASGTAATRQAKINLYNTNSQVSNAQQTRRDLASQIAAATLKAPIDGVVTSVTIVTGLEAPSGDAIVIDSAGLQVSAEVVESDLASMKLGQTAAVTIGAIDADVTGTVSAIAPNASAASNSGVVSYPVTISLTDAPATVRSGMTADVTITIDSANGVLAIPATALRGSAGAYTVLVMGSDGQPVSRAVEVGLVTSSLAEITAGLTAGQEVVTGRANAQTTTSSGSSGGFGGGGLGGGLGIPRDGARPGNGN